MRGERDVIRFVAILQQAPLKGISHRHAAPAVMTWKQPEAPHSSPPATTHPRSGLLQNRATILRTSREQMYTSNIYNTTPINTLSCTATISIGILLILLGLIILLEAWNKPKQLHVCLCLEFWYTDRSHVTIERKL